MPLFDGQPLQVLTHLGLGAAAEADLVGNPGQHPIHAVSGGTQCLDLLGLLPHAQDLRQCGGRRPSNVGHRLLQAEKKRRPGVIADEDLPFGRRRLGHQCDRVVGLTPGHDIERAGLDPWRFELGDEQHRFSDGGNDRHRETLRGHGLVAGEVREVGTDREQCGAHPGIRHQLLQTRNPTRVVEVHA